MEKKKNKTEHPLTGSFEVAEPGSASKKAEVEKVTAEKEKKAEAIEDKLLGLADYDEDQVASIMEQILSLAEVEKDLELLSTKPGCMLNSDTNPVWLYSITRRAFFSVANGSEILSIDKIDDAKSQCLINNDIFEVHNDMIKFIGWN